MTVRYHLWPLAEQMLGRMPGGHRIYDALGHMKHAREHDSILASSLRLARRSRALKPDGGHALDVGTGWYHRDAFLLYLAGEGRRWRVTLFDVSDKATLGSIRAHLQCVLRHAGDIGQAVGLTAEAVANLVQPLLALPTREAVYERCGFTLAITTRTDQPMAPEGSVDLVVSNCVLNHIPPAVLVPELRAIRATLAPDGVFNVLVGHDDHWAFHDRTANMFECYAIRDHVYAAYYETPFEYQSRIPVTQWPALFAEAGLAVKAAEMHRTEESLAAIRELRAAGRLTPRYAALTDDDLAVVHAYWTLRADASSTFVTQGSRYAQRAAG